MKRICLLLLAVGLTSVFGVDLVRDGRPLAAVVLSANPSAVEKFAAEELVRYVKLLTGADLPVSGKPASGLLPVRFGLADSGHLVRTPALEKALSRLRNDGFILQADQTGIQIISRHPAGIHFGNYQMLRKYGGIYWFHPETPPYVPRKKDFSVPDQLTVKNPMPLRMGVRAGNSVTLTPEVRENCALWNSRCGFQLNQYNTRGKPEDIRPGNHYTNATIEKLGHVPVCKYGGHALGSNICSTPGVDYKELKQEMDRIRREEIHLFKKKRTETIRHYAYFKLISRKHPEFFGLVDGKRCPAGIVMRTGDDFLGKTSMPCLSNPATRRQMVENVLAFKEKNCRNMILEYTLCCDDHSQWCECDECMKLLKSKGSKHAADKASDYWWDFVNYVSGELEKYPDIRLCVMIYRDYQAFPEKIRPIPRRNMRLTYAYHGRCYLHSLNDPKCSLNPPFRKDLEKWTAIGMPVSTFEYMNQLPGKCNYAFWEKAWIQDLKWFSRRNICHGDGGLVGPWSGYYNDESYFRRNASKARWHLTWLTGYFEWNPDDDFEQVRNDLFAHYYGPAWKAMKPYRQLLEKAMLDTGKCMGYGGGGIIFAAAYAQPGVAEQADRLLKQAVQLAGGDAVLLKRIAMDQKYFQSNWVSAGISDQGGEITVIARKKGRIDIDGNLSENAWITAPVLDRFFVISGSRDTPKKSEKLYTPMTRVRMLYDDANLYLGIEAEKDRGLVEDAADTGAVFQAMKGSHLEFQFASPALMGKYYHLALSHNGNYYSALTEGGRSRDLNKKIQAEYKIVDKPDRWFAEIRIPTAELGGTPDGTLWKMDIARFARLSSGYREYGTVSGYGMHYPDAWQVFSFGQGGNLLLNPSFEQWNDLSELSKDNGKKWKFPSKVFARHWTFQSNGGVAEQGNRSPAHGASYLRVSSPKPGWPAFVIQNLNAFGPEVRSLKVSMKLRGKGQVDVSLWKNDNQKVHFQSQSEEAWNSFTGSLAVKNPSARMMLIRIVGAVDLDDVQVLPEK